MSESKSGNSNPRKKAAQARAEQLAKEKRRDLMIKIIGAVAVLVVVVGIVVAAIVTSAGKKSDPNASPTATADPSNALPTGVDPASFGYPVNSAAPASAPKVEVWEDFQCPSCKKVEDTGSIAAMVEKAKAGKYNMQLRPTTFLDKNLRNTSSVAATSAWGCAIDAGKALEYHSAVFDGQPEKEGTGYTEAQLLEFGKTAGISGAAFDTFSACVKANTYQGWAVNSTQKFEEANVQGTPAIYVNGKELPNTAGVYGDPAKLIAAIDKAAAGQ